MYVSLSRGDMYPWFKKTLTVELGQLIRRRAVDMATAKRAVATSGQSTTSMIRVHEEEGEGEEEEEEEE